MGGYLPLIQKDSSTHIHGLTVYIKEGLSFACNLSLENSEDYYLCFRLASLYLLHFNYFFFLYRSPSSSLCTFFYSISSNIDEVLSINPSANFFVFGDFNVHHKDCLTYSGGTDLKLPCWLTFLLWYQIVTLMVLLFWIYFLLLTLVFVLQWLSLHWEILIILLSQFPLTFHQTVTRCPVSLYSLWLFSCWLGWSLWSFERCSMGYL